MSVADLHLQDLAQRLAQKQGELEEARRAYEARLTDLTRRKDELQAQLRAVDAEIQAVSSTVPAPATPPQPALLPAQAEDTRSLPSLLVDLVRAAGRPITAKELSDEVIHAN